MASKYLGASPRRLKKIMKRVDTTILPQPATFWSIGGHSLGSFAAMAAAKEFTSSSAASSLVLWGSPNLPNTRTNLRQSTSTMRVLVVQGSEDKLCSMDDTSREEFLLDLPSFHTSYQTIDGAGHNWFASVDAGDPNFLGSPSISMEQQQDEVVNITAMFLLEKSMPFMACNEAHMLNK
jgi:pimeloyl-ACP methyl ester carboxylesterase